MGDQLARLKAAAYSINAQQVMSNALGDLSLYELDGALFLLSVNLLGDAARDKLDPRLR